MMLWPVVLDTQVPWSLHMVHYYIYYYLALILLYTTNNQSHSINTVICGLQISSYSLTCLWFIAHYEIEWGFTGSGVGSDVMDEFGHGYLFSPFQGV